MTIHAISRKHFDASGALPGTAGGTTEQVEWFTDDGWTVIGVITCDNSEPDFSIALLGRDEHGTFHSFETETEFTRVVDARRILLAKMAMAVSAGRTVFPWRPSDG